MRQVRHSVQPYESAWMEWESDQALPDQIIQYCEQKFWVYDADVCGCRDIEFVVREHGIESYWQVEHAWWIQTEPEWDLRNEFDIKQIPQVQFTYPRINRNWLQLTHALKSA